MKTQTTVGQIVAGKNADAVVRMADLLNPETKDEAMYFVIEHVQEGLTVGITPRNPHNKKEHVEEMNAMVEKLNKDVASAVKKASQIQNQTKGEVKEMTMTVEQMKARVEELKGGLQTLETKAKRGEISFEQKVKEANALMKELDMLTLEIAKAYAAKEERKATTPVFVDPTAGIVDHTKRAKNPAFKLIGDGIEAAKDRLLTSMVVNDVVVHEIVPYAKPDRSNRIGHITFQVPAGMMEVKMWDGQKYVWVAMDDYDYNGLARTHARLTHDGSGFIRLGIREDENGVPAIIWPVNKDKNKERVWYDVFKTVDTRYGIMHSDNNHNVRAALTAFLLTFWGEFKQSNPRNRNGFNEHCGNCRHMVYLPVYDGNGEEFENKANPIDTSELGQWGSKMPQWICGVHKEFVDAEIIDDLNEADSYESRQYYDEEGKLRWARPNEVVIKGKPVNLFKLRAEGTAENCASCPFYCKNERKADKRYGAEVEQAVNEYKEAGGAILRNDRGELDLRGMGIFVSKYWTERAQADSQPVFTKHMQGGKATWELGFPGQFAQPVEFCVQGIGGIHIYGSEEVMQFMKADFVPEVKAFNAEEAEISKLTNIVHQVCNQFAAITPQTLDNLLAMIQSTPKPTQDPLKTRYNRAITRLATTIQDNQ